VRGRSLYLRRQALPIRLAWQKNTIRDFSIVSIARQKSHKPLYGRLFLHAAQGTLRLPCSNEKSVKCEFIHFPKRADAVTIIANLSVLCAVDCHACPSRSIRSRLSSRMRKLRSDTDEHSRSPGGSTIAWQGLTER